MSCKSCRFYDEDKHECHRYPPQCIASLEGDYFTEFPTTLSHEYCGEYQSAQLDASEMD